MQCVEDSESAAGVALTNPPDRRHTPLAFAWSPYYHALVSITAKGVSRCFE
jgi:hypothetical protein